MPMQRAPLGMPLAVAGAIGAAEAGVLLLRPRAEPIRPESVPASAYFSAEEIERGRRYRRPQRALGLAGAAIDAGLLALLVARPPRALRRRRRRPVLAAAGAGAALSVGLGAATLPLHAVGHRRAVDVGLATQDWPDWAVDVAKAWGIGAAFSGGGAAAGVALMRRLPRLWWAPGAAVAVGFGVVTTFLAPVVLEPLFNRFTPLPPGTVRDDVMDLARRAGVDVGEVFEVDASRRTTGANAYVNGIGRTKRVVLYDTLLRDFDRDEVRLVVAHELAHVRYRDVSRSLVYLTLVAPAGMLAVALVARRLAPEDERERPGPGVLPAVALAALLVSAPVSTVSNQLSRAIERRADAYALELTNAPDAFVGFEQRITVKNVAEPDPPAWAEVLFGTHPTTLKRIGAAIAFRNGARPAERRTRGGS
jgi:Zn-dependent protease with chaperone function